MSFVFFGTPEFSAIILENLVKAGLKPNLIICNPDRPVGRKQIITPPPTKVVAEKYGIAIWQPEKLDLAECRGKIGSVDFAVLAAYAKILPQEVVSMPRRGTVGVHPSLLPKYRGATPIQTTLLNGETETGTTLFLMDEKVDHGPILSQEKIIIAENDNTETLTEKLANLSSDLLVKTLPEFAAGRIQPQPQNHDAATYTHKFVSEDGLVDTAKDNPTLILQKIKALNPEPGVYTMKNGIRIKILDRQTIQFEGKKPKKVVNAMEFMKSL